MSANVLNWHAKAGRSVGIGAIDYTPARIGQTLHIPCSRGHRVDVEIKTRMGPELLGKKLLHAGWTIGNHLLCPKHSKKPKAPTPAPQQETDDMHPDERKTFHPQPSAVQCKTCGTDCREHGCPGLTPVPPVGTMMVAMKPATAFISTDAARTAKRQVMTWLEESFDVGKGQYSAGISDETIAKETGLAAAKVKELREEFYGALKEPSELQAFRERIERLAGVIAKTEAEAIGRVADLKRELGEMVARIEGLAKLNGWRS